MSKESKIFARLHVHSSPLSRVLIPVALFSGIHSLYAVDYTWDGGGGTAGWGNAAHWVGDTAPTFNTNANIIFYQAGTTNFNNYLGAARTVGGLTYNDNADSNVTTYLQSFSNVAVDLTLGSGSIAPTITVASGATGNFSIDNTTSVFGSVILANDLTITHNGSGTYSINRPITGDPYGITKAGSGTLILGGVNTYDGATTVTGGTLAVNGSITSAVTVQTGATLQGIGSITGSVTTQGGGTLATGNSIESLAITGNLTQNAASTFAFEMNNNVALSAAGDLTAVNGNLTLDGGALLTLTELGSGAWGVGEKLTLLSYSGSLSGLFTYNSITLADDSTFVFSGATWQFNYNDNVAGNNYTGDLLGSNYVTMTVIPEPKAALLGAIGVLLLLRRRRA